MAEKVMDIQMDKLVGFRNHPFQVKNDESLNALCESIRDYGVLSPLLARPTTDGNYEIVSGHRRKAAAMKLGMEKLPVLVREMTDEEAVILMVDSNIQRENLLPSEKAYAYKMKLEAMKRKAGRPVKKAMIVLADTSMYKPSNLFRSFQYMFDVNVIREWNEELVCKMIQSYNQKSEILCSKDAQNYLDSEIE